MGEGMAEWMFVTFTDGHLRTAVCVGLARVALSQSQKGIATQPMYPRIHDERGHCRSSKMLTDRSTPWQMFGYTCMLRASAHW